MNPKKRLGKWLVYILCLAPAAIMLGYYWLEHVPNRREYFMNLRFRSLATISDNLRIKIERLATSFNYALGQPAPSQYISALVPDLTTEGACQTFTGPGIALNKVEFGHPVNNIRFHAVNGCQAVASLAQILMGFSRDKMFEDILVADNSGRIVYQQSASSPRIVSLGELLKSSSSGKPEEGAGIDADALRTVRLDDSEFALLIQPMRLSVETAAGQPLRLCGLVRTRVLSQEARHVPPEYLLPLFAPLIILFLSVPFLKVLLLTRTGRLAFRDMVTLGVFSALAAAIVTVLLVSLHQYAVSESNTQDHLRKFAGALNEQILDDVNRMQGALAFLDGLPTTIGLPSPDLTNLLSSDDVRKQSRLDPLDLVFWTNTDGCQVAKWTTALQNFPRVDQTPQASFQNIIARDLWLSPAGKPFTLQTLVSPTTSRLIVIMAMPSSHAGLQIAGCGHSDAASVASISLVAQLRSLSWPVVPPGAGFAVFEPGGQVLFHSESQRNLHENLFEEIQSPALWRSAVANRVAQQGTAGYRGREIQMYVQPVHGIAGNRWSIAVFQEIEPRQAMIGRTWSETLMLFGLLLCLLALEALAVIAILSSRRGMSWRCQVDWYLDCLWPAPERRPVFRRLALELAAFTVVFLSLAGYGSTHAYGSGPWLLPFCFLAPAAALAFSAWRLWKPALSAGIPCVRQGQPAYFVAVSLLLVLLVVAPTMGFWSVCQSYEMRAQLTRWQQDLMKSVEDRRTVLRTDIESSRALSPVAKSYFETRSENRFEDRYVAEFWGTRIGSAPLTANAAPCQSAEEGDNLSLRCASNSGAPVEVSSRLPAIGLPTSPLWLLLAFTMLSGVYAWNCLAFGRLFLMNFRYSILPSLTSLSLETNPYEHLLVLGLPLARKDKAVRDWLGYEPPRVNLYIARFSKHWMDKTVGLLKEQLTAMLAPVAQVAVVGESMHPAAALPVKNWVHISNLDAKLTEPAERQVTAGLIEELVMMDVGESRVRLIVTSAVDPMLHFDSVLNDERKKIYEHPLPEPELQRLARLLHNFRKVQVPAPGDRPPDWAGTAVGHVIYEECRHQLALLDIGREVAEWAPPDAPRDLTLAMVAERSQALYKLYWSSCTRSEKLLLIQLAQTGFVNPLCLPTLEELIRKGLILATARPRIMNATFRRFLKTVEGPDTVRQWESEAGESSWLIIRNIVLVLVFVGLGVVGLTQYQFMQTATTALTAVVALVTGMSRLLGYVTGRRAEVPVVPA